VVNLSLRSSICEKILQITHTAVEFRSLFDTGRRCYRYRILRRHRMCDFPATERLSCWSLCADCSIFWTLL